MSKISQVKKLIEEEVRAVLSEGKVKGDLESIVDKHKLRGTVEFLADICFEKAEHIRANNGEKDRDAKAWDSDANTLLKISARLKNY